MYGHLNMTLIVKESGSYAILMSTNKGQTGAPGAVALSMRKILARPGRGLVSMCVTWLWLVHIELIKAKLRRFCKVRCALVNISELKQRRR